MADGLNIGVAGDESPEQSFVGQRGDDRGLTAVSTALHFEQLAARELLEVGNVFDDDCLMDREMVFDVVVVVDEVVGSKQIRAPRV